MPAMTEQEEKIAFAAALLRSPDDPFAAALSVINDTGRALEVATRWKNDPEVLTEKFRLIEEVGLTVFLPTKADQAKNIWEIASDINLEKDVRLRAHRLYAEIMNHIDKPTTTNNTNILNRGVMIVKDHGDDDAWEIKAQTQQRELILNATG